MIVSVCSVKGGVGKTCTCVNLAGAISLRKKKPKKVLVIDFDLQGGATNHLSSRHKGKFKSSLTRVLNGKSPVERAIHSYSDTLDFIPLSFDFSEMSDSDFSIPLKAIFDSVRKKYDFVFLDLCPTICKASTIPLSLSDTCIIPVYTKGGLSVLGLRMQAKVIVKIRQDGNRKLDIIGILPTFMGRTKVSKEVLGYLQTECGDECFETVIRENTNVSEAASLGKLIFEHSPQSNGAKDYEKFSREFLKRVRSRK